MRRGLETMEQAGDEAALGGEMMKDALASDRVAWHASSAQLEQAGDEGTLAGEMTKGVSGAGHACSASRLPAEDESWRNRWKELAVDCEPASACACAPGPGN